MNQEKKTIIRGTEETLVPMLEGAKKAYELITDTMGPGGGCIVIDKTITKDGSNVASNLDNIEEGLKQQGVDLICDGSKTMNKEVGDGTTTVTSIIYGFLEESLRLLRMGYENHEISKGLEYIESKSGQIVEKISEKIESNSKKMVEIATIASNGDRNTGVLLGDLFHKLGKEGVIQVEEARGNESEITVRPGFFFNNGPASQEFFKKNIKEKRQKISIEKAKVLVVDYKLDNISGNILKLLNSFIQSREHLIIIAEDYSNDFLNTIIRNVIPDLLKCTCIKAISFGDRKKQFLEDIAIVTGSKLISEEEELHEESLGNGEKILFTKDNTTIYGKGSKESIEKRIREIQELIKDSDSSYEKEYLKERLARINQGIGVFFAAPPFGKNNEVVLKEYKERVDDAIHACFNALKHGILLGGGIDFLMVKNEIEKSLNKVEERTRVIVKQLLKAFENPLKIIVNNTKKANAALVLKEITNSNFKKIFDGTNGKVIDFKKTGIFNPASVVLSATKIACSKTNQFINCKAALIENKTKEEKNINSPYPMY